MWKNEESETGQSLWYIYKFIKELRLSHFIDSKQLRFIENIGFYISDLVVYKIVVAVNPLTLKKSSKYNLPQQFNIHNDDFEHVKIKEPFKDTSKGKYILMYDLYKNEINVCQGEEELRFKSWMVSFEDYVLFFHI